ncbi:hypothetical protein EFK68_03120 [Pseudomonas aeruginosa]|nr:hypothetical protein EFK68_03120 [Pseudomonas aeruginosa]
MKAAKLNWEGLWSLPIPNEVAHGCYEHEIEICTVGLDQLPEPLNSATCWIYCRDAWPHVDPDFEGLMFITLAIQADHSYNQILPRKKNIRMGVFRGSLFITDPMAMHWLAPNNADTNAGFIGLQWEVSYNQIDTAYADLVSKLAVLGEVQDVTPPTMRTLLKATTEYNGAPPGY